MKILGMAVLLAVVMGCGSDEESACEVAYELLCDRACDCADGDECIVSAGAVSLTSDNRSDCIGFWVGLGCSDSSAGSIDFESCAADLDTAACVPAGDSNGVQMPMSCDDDTE